jgi:hypothetical protein
MFILHSVEMCIQCTESIIFENAIYNPLSYKEKSHMVGGGLMRIGVSATDSLCLLEYLMKRPFGLASLVS